MAYTQERQGTLQESRYITDENGERTAVILSIEEYERLMEALEDAEDVEHIKTARETRARIEAGEEETIPWERARARIGSEYSEPDAFRTTGYPSPETRRSTFGAESPLPTKSAYRKP